MVCGQTSISDFDIPVPEKCGATSDSYGSILMKKLMRHYHGCKDISSIGDYWMTTEKVFGDFVPLYLCCSCYYDYIGK